ncbi:MAG: hypothetical protein LBE36_00785 [Flavobacteriaceae bacterium]|jgi:hypothetical protein|nr:hypothetical protein [Flavobacteriaceae bacterium]
MKNIITFLAIFSVLTAQAQYWGLTGNSGTTPGTNFIGTTDNKDFVFKTNNLERMRILSSGSVGINMIPDSRMALDVVGQTRLRSNSTNADVLDVFNDEDNVQTGMDLLFLRYGKYQPNNPGIMTVSGWPTPTKYEAFFNLRANGKLGLGTTNFQNCSDCAGYRLFVKDGIRTEKVKVDVAQDNGWADYVFDEDYELTDLKTLEAYIKENKHLPEVPTTEEAMQNGIELKEMNILLLKKVEELTLYLIEQNKQIEEQNKRIEELENKLQKE